MIPVDSQTTSEINETLFYQIPAKVHALYYKEVKKRNIELSLKLDWKKPYFSAWAYNDSENHFSLNFWGGIARIPGVFKETWEFTACHEMGHVIGGYPKHKNSMFKWASAEGQSDHFAITDCLPKYYKHYKELDFDSTTSMPEEIDICLNAYTELDSQNICLKILKGGRGFADVLHYLNRDEELASYHKEALPVEHTLFDSYPTSQCRIDIFKTQSQCMKNKCDKNNCWYNSEDSH